VLLDIEVQGAAQVRRAYPWPDSVAIFLLPPSRAELVRRLEGRGTETPMTLWRRLDQARRELTEASKFDVIVVNEDLDRAVDEVGRAIDSAVQPKIPQGTLDRVNALIRDLTKGTN
jgi:guanylate kinase